MIYIGIDVGGTTIKAGAVDEQGNIYINDSIAIVNIPSNCISPFVIMATKVQRKE